MKKYIYYALLIFVITGCQTQKEVKIPQEVVKPKVNTQVDINDLFEEEANQNEDELYFEGSKNKNYKTKASSAKLVWIDVMVPHSNKKNNTTFRIMSRMVSKKEFLGNGSNTESVTNISYEAANNFCHAKFNGAVLSTPYIFEHARRNSLLQKPIKSDMLEMIAPVDYEDFDDTFRLEGDKLESSDEDVSTMIIFNWDSQKYYTISLSYKSNNMGFRCYK